MEKKNKTIIGQLFPLTRKSNCTKAIWGVLGLVQKWLVVQMLMVSWTFACYWIFIWLNWLKRYLGRPIFDK